MLGAQVGIVTVVAQVARRLRSPRLAIVLIGLFVVLMVVATLVPQGPSSAPEVKAFVAAHPQLAVLTAALGLHRAYTHPAFLLLLALLSVSTALCAWERTKWAYSWARRVRSTSERAADSARAKGTLLPLPEGTSRGVALDVAEEALAALAPFPRVRRSDDSVTRAWGVWGVFGSPLFHWALVAIVLVVLLGRAYRSEGLVGFPVGEPVADVEASYGTHTTGPLYRGHTGLTFLVTSIDFDNVVDGIDRKETPHLVLMDGERVLREQDVYANRPLRYGALLVHADDIGMVVGARLFDTTGATVGSSRGFIDFDAAMPDGTEPKELTVDDPAGVVRVRLWVRAQRDGQDVVKVIPPARAVLVSYRPAGDDSWTDPVAVPVGGELSVPGTDKTLKIDTLDYYARMRVADDWSVTPMYALFGIAVLGIGIAVLVSPRRVVVVWDRSSTPSLRVVARDRRGDPEFEERVVARLSEHFESTRSREGGTS